VLNFKKKTSLDTLPLVPQRRNYLPWRSPVLRSISAGVSRSLSSFRASLKLDLEGGNQFHGQTASWPKSATERPFIGPNSYLKSGFTECLFSAKSTVEEIRLKHLPALDFHEFGSHV
jgi:hypothetical protein